MERLACCGLLIVVGTTVELTLIFRGHSVLEVINTFTTAADRYSRCRWNKTALSSSFPQRGRSGESHIPGLAAGRSPSNCKKQRAAFHICWSTESGILETKTPLTIMAPHARLDCDISELDSEMQKRLWILANNGHQQYFSEGTGTWTNKQANKQNTHTNKTINLTIQLRNHLFFTTVLSTQVHIPRCSSPIQ